MLTPELMGILALCVVWINTGLIIAASFQTWVSLRNRKRAAMRELRWQPQREGLVELRVADNPELDTSFVFKAKQIGRIANKTKNTIVFADSEFQSQCLGTRLSLPDKSARTIGVEVPETSDFELWLNEERVRQYADNYSHEGFAQALRAAQTGKGFERRLAIPFKPVQRFWLYARIDEANAEPRQGTSQTSVESRWKVVQSLYHPLLVSEVDPIGWYQKKMRLNIGFMLFTFLSASGLSALALRSPAFGTVSTLGAALLLVYFLLIQPAGVWIADRSRTPNQAEIRGLWQNNKHAHPPRATQQDEGASA